MFYYIIYFKHIFDYFITPSSVMVVYKWFAENLFEPLLYKINFQYEAGPLLKD